MSKKKLGLTAKIFLTVSITILVGAAGYTGIWLYSYIKELNKLPGPSPGPDVNPEIDELTTVFNKKKDTWTTKAEIYVRDKLSPTFATISGIDVYIYQAGSTDAMISKGDAILLDGPLTTDSNGKATSVREFTCRTQLVAVVGLSSTTNKSMLKNFVMQGQDGDSEPTSINCGTFYYMTVAEEADITTTWCDNTGTSLSNAWNYSTDADGILEAKLKIVLGASGECLRDTWDQFYKTLHLIFGIKVTHENYTSSTAIDVKNSFDYKGAPSTNLCFSFALPTIIYEVDSTGQVEDGHESYFFVSIKLDFTGCSITHTVNQTDIFDIDGWICLEYDEEQIVNAGTPSGSATSWLKETLTALQIHG